MLLQSPIRTAPSCLRRWSLAAAVALLSLAVLGLSPGAYAEPESPKDSKKPTKDAQPGKAVPKEPKKTDTPPVPGLRDFEEMLKRLPPGTDKAQIERMRKQYEEMRNRMKAMRKMGPAGFPGMPGMPGMTVPFLEPRLGAMVKAPSGTLVDQFDLPRDRGVVLERVPAGSAAAKGGLKAHDILLELNGKPVPSKPGELMNLLKDIKPDAKVEAVVLRKARKETIKDLSLPEAKGFPGFGPGFGPPAVVPPRPPTVPAFPPPPAFTPPGFAGGRGVMTTLFRTADRFTINHHEGSLNIMVMGKVEDGKQKVSEIQVRDGAASHRYESVDKVPARYRTKVKSLVDRAEKTEAPQ